MSGADTDAIGAWLTLFTVTVVVAAALVTRPSLTVTEKVRRVVVVTCGAVKSGEAAVALLSVTAGPPVCVQAYVRGSPSGSVLPAALITTESPSFTVCGALALATGGRFTS